MILARNFDECAAQRINKQNGVGNYLHGRWINSIFCHYFQENLNQGRFWATYVNRKWTFCTLEPRFWTNLGKIVSLRVKLTLSNSNLVVPRHVEKKKANYWPTSVAQKRRCLNSLEFMFHSARHRRASRHAWIELELNVQGSSQTNICLKVGFMKNSTTMNNRANFKLPH